MRQSKTTLALHDKIKNENFELKIKVSELETSIRASECCIDVLVEQNRKLKDAVAIYENWVNEVSTTGLQANN